MSDPIRQRDGDSPARPHADRTPPQGELRVSGRASTFGRLVDRFLLLATLGLVAGLAEGLVRLLHHVVPNAKGWSGDLTPQILWIAPIFDLLLFLVLGSLILLLGRILPKHVRGVPLVWAAFGAFATYGAVTAISDAYKWDFYWWAVALLCLGAAVRLYLTFNSQPLAERTVRRGLLRFSGLVILAAFAEPVLAALRRSDGSVGEQPGLDGLLSLTLSRRDLLVSPARAGAAPPNVLIVVLDTLRADHVSAYGYARQTTPHLDALARSGALFENAFTTAWWTPPAHASLFTGRYVFEHHADGQPLGPEYPTLAEHFAANRYSTAAFIANTDQLTRAKRMDRGFQVWEDYYSNAVDMGVRTVYGGLLLSEGPRVGYYAMPGRKDAATVNAEFLGWLEATPNAPFFAFLNYFDVHDPYQPPAPYDRRFTDTPSRGDRLNHNIHTDLSSVGKTLSPEQIEIEVAGYDGALAYLDSQLGALFDRLRTLGVLDSTVVIVTSDHGEQFGNHGLWGHGNSLYQDILHVPLIVRFPPSVPSGVRIPCAASLQAIPSTVLDIAGYKARSPFTGESLALRWAEQHGDAVCDQRFAFAETYREERKRTKSLSTRQWHLLLDDKGEVALYRTDQDPSEQHNRADTAEGKQTIATLGAHLEGLMPADEWQRFAELIRTHS
jgi:arylsulfatase A-like enzyme